MRRGAVLMAAIAVGLASLPAPGAAYPRPRRVERVDVSSRGEPAANDEISGRPSISANGRFVAFETEAALARNDTNGMHDIYVRDLKKGTTELVTQTLSGLPAKPPVALHVRLSFEPSISADGRFVAFVSRAVNLVVPDTNGIADVFVWDRITRHLERVSVGPGGREAMFTTTRLLVYYSPGSSMPSISGNGRYVSFTSDAFNLVENDDNNIPDIFVRDRKLDRTMRISVSSGEQQAQPDGCLERDTTEAANAFSTNLFPILPLSSIGDNGRYVAFSSESSNLVPGDTNDSADVFVRDLRRGTTRRVSVNSHGEQAIRSTPPMDRSCVKGSSLSGDDGWTSTDNLSADGRYVVFASNSSNLVPSDTNNEEAAIDGSRHQDIYVHDRNTGDTERINVESDGRELSISKAAHPSISADGRYVSFSCWDCGYNALGPGFRVGTSYENPAVYVYDRRTGAVDPGPSRSQNIVLVNGQPSDISRSGRHMVFEDQVEDGSAGFDDMGIWVVYRGPEVGAGDQPRLQVAGSSADARRRFARSRSIVAADARGDAIALPGDADEIVGLRIIHRLRPGDLWVKLRVERLLRRGLVGNEAGATTVHVVSVRVRNAVYELRAAWSPTNVERPFALFRCSASGTDCVRVADIRGGYGTAGESIVASVPLAALGLDRGGTIRDVRAVSGAGNMAAGIALVADELALD